MNRYIIWVTSFLAIAIMAVGTAQRGACDVVINEYSYDDSGTDDREFVELYNAGSAPMDISDWVLASNDPIGTNNPYTITTGTILEPGTYYVMASFDFPNVDQVVGGTNIWENDQETLELRDVSGFLHDAILYEANKGTGWEEADVSADVGGGWWGNFTSIDGTVQSVGRWRDGVDTNVNGRDFGLLPSTPGASNDLPLNRDYQPPDVDDPEISFLGYHASFAEPRVIDPTVIDEYNPNAIPRSPQGGNAIVAWEPTGGGNMIASDEIVAGSPGKYRLMAYLDKKSSGAGLKQTGKESTTYGIGTTGTYYNLPDPIGTGADEVTANGNTGVGWLFEKEYDSGEVNLYLVDFGEGGDSSPVNSTPQDWMIIATIGLTNEPSAWHRLSISIDGNGDVTAGYDDQVFNFRTNTAITGTFYVGYRESLDGTPEFLRPPTFDQIPEPSTFALIGLGILGLVALARRRLAR